MATILGIDPGMSGAAAVLRVEPEGVAALLWLSTGRTLEPVSDGADLVVVEAQHASPRMGVVSAFLLGQIYGHTLGMLEATGMRVVVTQPVVWRGAFGLTSKAGGIAMAREVIGEPTRALRHDEADAILLAWWGWRMVLSKAG